MRETNTTAADIAHPCHNRAPVARQTRAAPDRPFRHRCAKPTPPLSQPRTRVPTAHPCPNRAAVSPPCSRVATVQPCRYRATGPGPAAPTISARCFGLAAPEEGLYSPAEAGLGEVVPARVREITDGRGVSVVYDGVGKDTFDISMLCLAKRALLVCLGTASGPVPTINPPELVRRGSVYVTRPALADYISDPAERSRLVGELFDHVAGRRIDVEINQRYRLDDAAQAHRDLEARRTTGSSIFDLTL